MASFLEIDQTRIRARAFRVCGMTMGGLASVRLVALLFLRPHAMTHWWISGPMGVAMLIGGYLYVQGLCWGRQAMALLDQWYIKHVDGKTS